jgi:peptide/nickel transport system substrate-binding protein
MPIALRALIVALAAVLTPVGAQVLVTALPLNPTSLDPQRAIEGYSFMVTNQVYDTLVRLGEGGAIEPALAVAWSRPEPTVLRLELREGVRFHDGRPLDAAAVAASLRRLTDPSTGARGAFLLAALDDVRVVDARTLDLITDPPFVPLLANLTFPATAIVPPGAGPELGRAPIGTGAFRFAAWRDGDAIELVANEAYWGVAPELAGVTFRVVPDASAQEIAFRAGDLDLIHDLTPDAVVGLADQPGVVVVRYPSERTSYLEFNTQHPVLSDLRVRRALAHALDTELLVDALFGGLALPPTGPLAPLVRFALNDPDPYPYDPERARALLREAGAADLSLTLDLTNDGGMEELVAQYVQAALADVGVTVALRRSDFPTLWALLTSDAAELSIGFWGSDTLDPDFMLGAALHGRELGGNNTSRYANPDFDALLDRGATTSDEAQRAAIYAEAQRMVLADLPMLPLYHHVGTYAKRATLEGERVLGSSFQLDLRRARFTGATGD